MNVQKFTAENFVVTSKSLIQAKNYMDFLKTEIEKLSGTVEKLVSCKSMMSRNIELWQVNELSFYDNRIKEVKEGVKILNDRLELIGERVKVVERCVNMPVAKNSEIQRKKRNAEASKRKEVRNAITRKKLQAEKCLQIMKYRKIDSINFDNILMCRIKQDDVQLMEENLDQFRKKLHVQGLLWLIEKGVFDDDVYLHDIILQKTVELQELEFPKTIGQGQKNEKKQTSINNLKKDPLLPSPLISSSLPSSSKRSTSDVSKSSRKRVKATDEKDPRQKTITFKSLVDKTSKTSETFENSEISDNSMIDETSKSFENSEISDTSAISAISVLSDSETYMISETSVLSAPSEVSGSPRPISSSPFHYVPPGTPRVRDSNADSSTIEGLFNHKVKSAGSDVKSDCECSDDDTFSVSVDEILNIKEPESSFEEEDRKSAGEVAEKTKPSSDVKSEFSVSVDEILESSSEEVSKSAGEEVSKSAGEEVARVEAVSENLKSTKRPCASFFEPKKKQKRNCAVDKIRRFHAALCQGVLVPVEPLSFESPQFKIFPNEDRHGTSLIPPNCGLFDAVALETTGDGNCLFNAVSILLFGDERASVHLRMLTAAELFGNASRYVNHRVLVTASQDIDVTIEFLFPDMVSMEDTHNIWYDTNDQEVAIRQEALTVSKNYYFSSLLAVMGLSSVIRRPINSIYPTIRKYKHRSLFNQVIQPLSETSEDEVLHILWSRIGKVGPGLYVPNHFVPLISKHIV